MAKSTEKKLISLVERDLIEKMIKDEAEVEHRSASALIEKHILNSLLPEQENPRGYIMYLYKGIYDLQSVLEGLYGELSAGAGSYLRTNHANTLPFLEFSIKMCPLRALHEKKDAEGMNYFFTQMESVIGKMEFVMKKSEDAFLKQTLEQEIGLLKDILESIKKDSYVLSYRLIYSTLRINWKHLHDYTSTYRLMACMCRMQNEWNNTAESRYRLTHLIKTYSTEWYEQ